MELTMSVRNGENKILSEARGEEMVMLIHRDEYREGDRVVFTCSEPGFYEVMFEDTLPPSIVYVERQAQFVIPFGLMPRIGYSPRAFGSGQHFYTARPANPAVPAARRNLALNPYDQHGDTGMFPHARANVETRGEALFAARNVIDGMFANSCHYPYPFQSWGINQDPCAELRVEFGVPVDLDSVDLTLRADYPHDSYWVQATLEFSDGSRETVRPEKSALPQRFPMSKKGVTWLVLKELVKAEDESPFPALTQIEAWGTVCRKK